MNENQKKTIHTPNKRSIRAMLIFNPSVGATRASPIENGEGSIFQNSKNINQFYI